MKTRTIFSNKKNGPYLGHKNVSHSNNPTAFFSQPAEVHTVTFERVFDQFNNELVEDWTFLGECEDWELISNFGPTA